MQFRFGSLVVDGEKETLAGSVLGAGKRGSRAESRRLGYMSVLDGSAKHLLEYTSVP